jgi:hypothetical protein
MPSSAVATSFVADGIEMRLEHGRETELGCRDHPFLAASLSHNAARLVDAPKPKAAGAPINRDVSSLAHFNSVLISGIRALGGKISRRLFILGGYRSVQRKSEPAPSSCLTCPPYFF